MFKVPNRLLILLVFCPYHLYLHYLLNYLITFLGIWLVFFQDYWIINNYNVDMEENKSDDRRYGNGKGNKSIEFFLPLCDPFNVSQMNNWCLQAQTKATVEPDSWNFQFKVLQMLRFKLQFELRRGFLLQQICWGIHQHLYNIPIIFKEYWNISLLLWWFVLFSTIWRRNRLFFGTIKL